jgi:hypothetical protein
MNVMQRSILRQFDHQSITGQYPVQGGRGFAWVLQLLALMCLFSVAGGDALADITKDDLAKLGDVKYTVRHAAFRKLMFDETVSPAALLEMYRLADSPEQKHRLISLARHHVIRDIRQKRFKGVNPDGALGLMHAGVTPDEVPQLKGRSAILVRKTMPGFPAHAALQGGDLIIAIQGQPIPSGITRDRVTTIFGDRIRDLPAGKAAEFEILRDGKTQTVTVKLANTSALDRIYGGTEGLEEPYAAMWGKYLESMVKSKKLPTPKQP